MGRNDMSAATATEAPLRPRRLARKALRVLVLTASGVVLLLLTLWAAAALYFDGRMAWLRTPLAVARTSADSTQAPSCA